MPKRPIPIIVPDDKQFDNFTLSDYSKRQINGIVSIGVSQEGQKTYAWQNRPGLEEWIDLGEDAPVDGLYWWARQETLVATCNGKTFFIDVNETVNEKTGAAPMTPNIIPSYEDLDGTVLYQASGGQIGGYLAGAGSNGYYLSDPQVPPNVTHLATLNKIMLALPANTDRFEWSVVNDAESWDADFATASTSTDLARGLYVNNSEIAITGQTSFEIWRDSGTTFVRELQGFLQIGIIAPDSFTIVDREYFWLSHNKEVVRLTGRTPTIISGPYARYLKSITSAEDAIGKHIKVDGKSFYMLTFPTENKTLVFDIESDIWCEWGSWNGTSYDSFAIKSATEAPEWGFSVVGSNTTGKIYKIALDNLDDAGTVIRGMVRTDHLDHGDIDRRKFCKELAIKIKRSAISDVTPATMQVRYRDDGKLSWSDYRTVNIEKDASSEYTARLRRLGSYKKRQYEFSFPDATDIVLVSVEEDVDYGR